MNHATPADIGKTQRALRWIGDLDHPFYGDERTRHVWYEGSAIAFQLLLLSNYFMLGLVLWVAGGTALPYALALFAPTMITTLVFQLHITNRSAECCPGIKDLIRPRGQFAIAVVAFGVSGAIRATLDLTTTPGEGSTSSFVGGLGEGAIVGLVIGLIGVVAGLILDRRKHNRTQEADEFEPLPR